MADIMEYTDKQAANTTYSPLAMTGILSAIVVGMFCFAVFIMPPLYDVFCEVTGLNGKSDSLVRKSASDFNREQSTASGQSSIDNTTAANITTESTATDGALASLSESTASSPITLQFLADTHKDIPWEFRPTVFSMKIEPGKRYNTSFFAKNLSDKTIVGQAVPSVSPGYMGQYLQKIECFCFTQQTLAGHEEKEMPLSFSVSDEAPADISTITLSYMLYNKSESTTTNNP